MLKLKSRLNKINLNRFDAGIWTVSGIQAINVVAFSVGFPYLPLYLYQERHISLTLVGVLILITGILSAIFLIPGGILADRIGHRRTFILFQSIGSVGFAALAVLIGVDASTPLIILISIAVPVVAGMASPALSAIIADISTEDRLAESYGLYSIGGNVGWAIGPLAGGYLLNWGSYVWPFGAAALVLALSLIGAVFLPRGTEHQEADKLSFRSIKAVSTNYTLNIFCVLCILVFLETGQWGNTLSVFLVDRVGFAPEQYGLLMTISGIIIIIFQYPISRRIEGLGFGKALILGSLFYGAGFLSLSWTKSFIPAVGSITLLVIGEMLFIPTTFATVGKISRPEDRGKNLGFLGLCETLGGSLGPLMGGYLLDTFPVNPLMVWGPIASTAFIAAFCFVWWSHYYQKRTVQTNTHNPVKF